MSLEGEIERRPHRHDVFISHSSKNKTVADTVCAVLERRGIRCWIAPRDIMPGQEWAQAIIRGIADCRAFVLIFSSFSNDSAQVRREVERAANHEVPIIPFRIDDVPAHESLEFFISSPHWLDALSPPMEAHAERLADVVASFLSPGAADDDFVEALEPATRPAAPPPQADIAPVTPSRAAGPSQTFDPAWDGLAQPVPTPKAAAPAPSAVTSNTAQAPATAPAQPAAKPPRTGFQRALPWILIIVGGWIVVSCTAGLLAGGGGSF